MVLLVAYMKPDLKVLTHGIVVFRFDDNVALWMVVLCL